jgi:hypothetical protein
MDIEEITDEELEEEFIIPVPEDAEEGDDLVFPVVSEEEAAELLAEL